ncbi:hypothetical protein [Endozoicomonas atrinae]|uniref:hypothetical protein n=1 Tax=Endozoicomonas atrinae TaxID=1333660 RepID=UPI003B0092B9
MTSPLNSVGTTLNQTESQQECYAASIRRGQASRAFQRKADIVDIQQQYSYQQGDPHAEASNGKMRPDASLTQRSSQATPEFSKPQAATKALSPTEQIIEELKKCYVDTQVLTLFEAHFYESFPERLKSIYLDCKKDFLTCFKFLDKESMSDADEEQLSKLLTSRLTEMTTELIRLSKEIKLEETEWFVPTVLILDELKILLCARDNKQYIRPMYQLACAVFDDNTLPIDRRLDLLTFMQEHHEELDFTANEDRVLESFIKSLLEKHQPNLDTALATGIEEIHIHEPQSDAPPSLPAKQEKISANSEKPPKAEMQMTQSASVTYHPHKTTAAPENTVESSREQMTPSQDSAPSHKKHRKHKKKKQTPQRDEIDVALSQLPPASKAVVSTQPVAKTPEVSHGRFETYLKIGNPGKAINQLTADNINKPVSGAGFPPIFYLLEKGLLLETRYIIKMVNKGCNLNEVFPLLIQGHTVKTSPLLYAIYKYDTAVNDTLSEEEQCEQARITLGNFRHIIEAGADVNMTAEFLRKDMFEEYTPHLTVKLSPLQLAFIIPSRLVIEHLLTKGANPDTPLEAGDLTCDLAHVACMKIVPDTVQMLDHLYKSSKFKTTPNTVTSDGSTVMHLLAKSAVLKVKNLETTQAKQGKKQVYKLQQSAITDLEQLELKQLSESLQKHGTDFERRNNHQQTALEVFRTQVEQEISDERLKQDMKKLEVFFTQQNTAVVSTPPVLGPSEKSHGDFLTYLQVGWINKAIAQLKPENINEPVTDEALPPLFLIFNHKVSLTLKHITGMIEKGCDINITPDVSINGVTVRASIVLYAIYRIAVIHSSTLPPEEKGELEEVILNNLSLLIEAGADVNMPSEFLTEDIFREFITEPVMIYRPVQLAIAKQQDEVIEFLLERGANPHEPLHPGYPEYYPVHIACMKVSNNAPDTLEALFSPSEVQVNPNAL